MADWDLAEQTIIDAATKVFIALGEANPRFRYDNKNGNHVMTIDGRTYRTFLDCTGMMRMIIRVMGYDPNWGGGNASIGHGGAGWFLSDATGPFVKNLDGEISEDWVVLDFDPNDVRPGDIRGHNGHSHADFFIGYDSRGVARGYNSGSSDGMKQSNACALNYLSTGVFDIEKATTTIQDSRTAKVLRYVRGTNGQPYSSPTQTLQSGSIRINSLDVNLKFVPPPEIIFALRTKEGVDPSSLDSFIESEAGYWKPSNLYKISGNTVQSENYSMADNQKTDIIMRWKNLPKSISKPVLVFTADGSDPKTSGRTIKQTEGGNDYQNSAGIVVLFSGWSLPLNLRAILVDADKPDEIIASGSGIFTSRTPSAIGSGPALGRIFYYQELLDDVDADGGTIDTPDNHGYLQLNDSNDLYNSEEYTALISGLEGDNG